MQLVIGISGARPRVLKKLPRKRRRKGKPHMSTWGSNRGESRTGARRPSPRPPQARGPGSPATLCTRGPGQVEQRQRVKKLPELGGRGSCRVPARNSQVGRGLRYNLRVEEEEGQQEGESPATSRTDLCRGTAGQRGPVTQSPSQRQGQALTVPRQDRRAGRPCPDSPTVRSMVPLTQGAQAVQAALW